MFLVSIIGINFYVAIRYDYEVDQSNLYYFGLFFQLASLFLSLILLIIKGFVNEPSEKIKKIMTLIDMYTVIGNFYGTVGFNHYIVV